MSSPILVCSVYGATPRNATWYRLQRKFLNHTTPQGYDMAVVLNDVPRSLFDPDVTIVDDRSRNHGHCEGMQRLLDYCRSTKHEQYLFLDSDCFPVWSNWASILCALTRKFAVEFAAAIRVENLDVHPHPCAFFASREGISAKGFGFEYRKGRDLLGNELMENQFSEIKSLPLVRSNVVSPHPVWASVYHHLFYHHGAGSRVARTRSTAAGYFDHYLDPDEHQRIEGELFQELQAEPEAFIGRLLGQESLALSHNGHSEGGVHAPRRTQVVPPTPANRGLRSLVANARSWLVR